MAAKSNKKKSTKRKTTNNISTKNVANNVATENLVKNYHEATQAYVNEKSGEITKDINSFFSLVSDDSSLQIVADAQRAYVNKLIKNKQKIFIYIFI